MCDRSLSHAEDRNAFDFALECDLRNGLRLLCGWSVGWACNKVSTSAWSCVLECSRASPPVCTSPPRRFYSYGLEKNKDRINKNIYRDFEEATLRVRDIPLRVWAVVPAAAAHRICDSRSSSPGRAYEVLGSAFTL